jgi:hypothetical protein
MSPVPPDDHEALTLQAAAIRLGLSADAVRKRLDRGTLLGTKQDGRWHVYLPVASGTDRTEADIRPDTDRNEAVGLLRSERDWLRSEVERLGAALEWEQIASAELRRLLAMQTPALPAPQGPAVAGTGGPENASDQAGTVIPFPGPRRRRWVFWWR